MIALEITNKGIAEFLAAAKIRFAEIVDAVQGVEGQVPRYLRDLFWFSNDHSFDFSIQFEESFCEDENVMVRVRFSRHCGPEDFEDMETKTDCCLLPAWLFTQDDWRERLDAECTKYLADSKRMKGYSDKHTLAYLTRKYKDSNESEVKTKT